MQRKIRPFPFPEKSVKMIPNESCVFPGTQK